MKKTLRQALAFILLLMMLLSLAACAGSGENSAAPGAPAPAKQSPARTKTDSTPSPALEPEQTAPTAAVRSTVYLPLSINEVMLSNKATLADESGM